MHTQTVGHSAMKQRMDNRNHRYIWFAYLLDLFEISLVSMHHFSQLMPVSDCCTGFGALRVTTGTLQVAHCKHWLKAKKKLVLQTAKYYAHDIVNRTLVPALDADMNQCMPKYGPALQNFREQTTSYF